MEITVNINPISSTIKGSPRGPFLHSARNAKPLGSLRALLSSFPFLVFIGEMRSWAKARALFAGPETVGHTIFGNFCFINVDLLNEVVEVLASVFQVSSSGEIKMTDYYLMKLDRERQ
jgi:hypothetical protein